MAVEAESKSVAAVAEQAAIQTQLNDAMASIERERDTFEKEKAMLKAVSEDESLGIVKRNTAKAQLAQLSCTDPLPLQRAIISHSAVVRRQNRNLVSAAAAETAAKQARAAAESKRAEAVNKRAESEEQRSRATSALRQAKTHRKNAAEAHEKAEEGKVNVINARIASEESKAEAEKAVEESVKSYQAAQSFLAEVQKESTGAGKGKLWWITRELEEAKKYMSQAQLARLGES